MKEVAGSSRAVPCYLMSCVPQSVQYVFLRRRLSACSSSLHFLTMTFALTTSPQFGQCRTGAFERL